MKERRRHARFPLSRGVEVYHGPTQREFPAWTLDVSDGGAQMYLPATTPVQVGQPIRVHLGNVPHRDLSGTLDATVVRVDRGKFLANAQIAIGVRFARA